MSVLLLLIPLSVLMAAGFLGAFFWAVRSGQYEDTCTPALRILTEDAPPMPRSGAAARPAANAVEVPASGGEPSPGVVHRISAATHRTTPRGALMPSGTPGRDGNLSP
jgi:cbb3-type cytochrome oxidase maturation protein